LASLASKLTPNLCRAYNHAGNTNQTSDNAAMAAHNIRSHGPAPASWLARRRVIRLVAAASSLSLAGALGALAGRSPDSESSLHRWQGTALGADASLLIDVPDTDRARQQIALARAEIDRLERIFSLYRPDSALSRLNEEGQLLNPPPELAALLGQAQNWGALSGGAFDVTVQPLWRLYREHFSQPGADSLGPPEAAVVAARKLVDYRAIDVSATRIVLTRPGMAVTLNGIAQGEITDRVATLLRAEGLGHALIDLGEFRALSSHPSGRPWKLGIKDPRAPGSLLTKVALTERALATSAISGTRFDAEGRHHHLFDPRSGRPSRGLVAASVIARRARDADAFSTALLATREPLALQAVAHLGIERVLTLDAGGAIVEWSAPAPISGEANTP
jgi:thiamine biosynthesis lipoprotein